MSIEESVGKVKNPLSMVALFAAISEVAMAFVITKLPDKLQEIFIWFVMGFPTILVFIFFFILYRKPAVFFSPGDYKKEELYVSSIGLSKADDVVDQRVRKLEETLTSLQGLFEKGKLGSTAQAEYSEVQKTIQRQQQLEANPLYAFITRELRIEHSKAQQLITEASDALELARLVEANLQDRRSAARLLDLVTSFPSATIDFKKLKAQLEADGDKT